MGEGPWRRYHNSGAIAVYHCMITNNVGQIVPYDELDLATLKSFGSGFTTLGRGLTFIGCILSIILLEQRGDLTSKADLFHTTESFTSELSHDQGGVSERVSPTITVSP